jgi:multicomponent K+:H+ antiporter subunit E
VLGVVLAIVGGWAMTTVELPRMRVRRPITILSLAAHVVLDITRSNIAVARIILRSKPPPHAGFVRIPLDLQDRYALAVLACILTATPGTVWVDFDRATRILIIHVLDLVDEGDWIRTIKQRYERPLLEIFA